MVCNAPPKENRRRKEHGNLPQVNDIPDQTKWKRVLPRRRNSLPQEAATMSFKDFAATHTGRRFFDSFAHFVDLLESLVAQLTVLNENLERMRKKGDTTNDGT
jgi:hypothetical protein